MRRGEQTRAGKGAGACCGGSPATRGVHMPLHMPPSAPGGGTCATCWCEGGTTTRVMGASGEQFSRPSPVARETETAVADTKREATATGLHADCDAKVTRWS